MLAEFISQSSTPYRCRSKYVLCKDNSLRLNDEEVDELVNITDDGVEGVLRNGVVFSWAELRC